MGASMAPTSRPQIPDSLNDGRQASVMTAFPAMRCGPTTTMFHTGIWVLSFLLQGTCLHAAEKPFPQHVMYAAGSIAPKMAQEKMDAAAAAFYDVWKVRYLHAGCVGGQAYIDYNRENRAEDRDAISVSEGHGYGMMITAFFAGHDEKAQEAFDQLYAFFRAHPSHFNHDLMAWQQVRGCKSRKGDDDSASDGDLDIAYALLLAEAQWGSGGAIHYRKEALKVIAAIQKDEINVAIPSLKAGDWAQPGMAQVNDTRVSDFMPDHFRVFANASGNTIWTGLLDKEYQLIARLQSANAPATGLLPDFARRLNTATPVPAGAHYMESSFDGGYFYNACRCPWRIGTDYLLTGDPRARAALDKLNAFIQKATGGDPDHIRAGYTLAGKVIHADDTSLAFTAPFAVAGMADARNQEWLDRLWEKIVSVGPEEDDYYGNTIKLLCLVALSRNWWEPS
jgi:endo-1,4-beta-D-glucanase Y